MTPGQLFVSERLDDFHQMIEEACANGQAQRETWLQPKSGQILPVELFLRIVEANHTRTGLLFLRDISDPRRVEESLREARAALHAINSAVPTAVITLDTAKNIIGWNAAAEATFGWREYEVYGRPLPFIPEQAHDDFAALCERASNRDTVPDEPLRLPLCRKDETRLEAEITAVPLLDTAGNDCGILLALTDLTDRAALEAKLAQTTHALTMVSETKKAIFRSTTAEELLREVCQTICTAGGYTLAWIGFLDDAKVLTPAAWSGEPDDLLTEVRIACGKEGVKTDPIHAALRTGAASVIQHLRSGDRAAWLRHPLQHGAAALGVFPLLLGIRPLGALVVYAGQPEAFSERDTDLLVEISDDLSFGIEAMRIRDERERAQTALRNASRHWRATFDAIIDPVCVVQPNRTITRGNRAAARFYGKELCALIGLPYTQAIREQGIACDTTLFETVFTSGESKSEVIAHKDRWYNMTIDPMLDDNGTVLGVVQIMSDITARKATEEELQRNYRRLQSIINDTIIAITKIAEMRDSYTAGHEKRVSGLACAIARKMHFSDERLEGLRVGGLLHDIGKLYVPAEMLSKPGKLSDMEFGVIKAHTQAGYEVVKSIDFPWPIAQMVYQHHERMDGSGYPKGIAGDQILLEARILAVSDVVESMASHRPYRPARGLDKALNEVQQRAGTAYDADVVAACVSVFNDDHYELEQ